jgi:hypothetical protein
MRRDFKPKRFMTQFLEGEMKLIIFQEKNIKEVENMSS